MSKIITTEMFKDDIKELGNGEYELLSDYEGAKIKVKMKHIKCGNTFDIRPSNFKSGNRCPFCCGKRHNINEAIEKADSLNMDLLETEYKGIFDKMKYICRLHPEFGEQYTSMTALNQGHTSCPKCRYEKARITQVTNISIEEIKDEFKDRNLTLLSKEYINCKSYLEYICNTHPEDGTQKITYDAFKNNNVYCCNSCAKEHISEIKQTPFDEMVRIVEDNNFDFIDSYKIGRRTMVHCICNNHRDKGIQSKSLQNLKNGKGCMYCAGVAKFTQEEFEEKVYCVDKNIQVLSEYDGNTKPVKCKCSSCGYEWESVASNIMYGGGCPNCSGSKGEMRIRDFLDDIGYKYIREYTFDNLYGDCDKQLRFDFAVFDNDSLAFLVEFDGIQHFKPVDFWGKDSTYSKIRFQTLKRYDKRKDNYCKEHGITLIRIPYTEFENIEDILEKQIA